jgi:hypothetical protein
VRPRLFALLYGVSLIVLALSILGWVRSYFPENFRMEFADGKLFLVFEDGALDLRPQSEISPSLTRDLGMWKKDFTAKWEAWGFGYYAYRHLWRVIAVPFYFVTVIAATPVVICHLLYRRHGKRVREGRCLSCGYDLRASKDKCPECGTAIVSSSTTIPPPPVT